MVPFEEKAVVERADQILKTMLRLRIGCWGILSCCGVVALPIPAPAAVCYRVTELDASNLVGAYSVEPRALNDSGKMTGIIYYTNKPYSMLYYSPESGFVDLGTWKGMGTRGMDINEGGQIAVQVGDQEVALRYSPGIGFETIGSLHGHGPDASHASLKIDQNGNIA